MLMKAIYFLLTVPVGGQNWHTLSTSFGGMKTHLHSPQLSDRAHNAIKHLLNRCEKRLVRIEKLTGIRDRRDTDESLDEDLRLAALSAGMRLAH